MPIYNNNKAIKYIPPPTSDQNPISAVYQHDRFFYFLICPIFAPNNEKLPFFEESNHRLFSV